MSSSLELEAAAARVAPNADANFDRVARYYGALETIAFGDALQRARVAFLEDVPRSSRALVVGEGNGRFLGQLLRSANPEITIDCVDSSAEMLRLAQERTKPFVIPSAVEGSRGRTAKATSTGSLGCARDDWLGVRFHHADFLNWQSDRSDYDLIVTHFFLDCFGVEQLPDVIDKITALAAPNARWLISDFNLPPDGLARLHAHIWLRTMYSFFRLAANLRAGELIAFAPLLRARGFELRARREWRGGLISAQLWQS